MEIPPSYGAHRLLSKLSEKYSSCEGPPRGLGKEGCCYETEAFGIYRKLRVDRAAVISVRRGRDLCYPSPRPRKAGAADAGLASWLVCPRCRWRPRVASPRHVPASGLYESEAFSGSLLPGVHCPATSPPLSMFPHQPFKCMSWAFSHQAIVLRGFVWEFRSPPPGGTNPLRALVSETGKNEDSITIVRTSS